MVGLTCDRCRRLEAEASTPCVVSESSPCSPCKEREIIRHRIDQLEDEIAKLEAKHLALGSAVNAIHDPFIHKMPPEIASYIFRLTLPISNYKNLRLWGIQEGLAGTLRLGAVCRKWRQLAWATPDLWETIYLAIRPLMTRSLAESLPGLLHEWLGRSGVLPLTIVFHHSGRRDSHAFGDDEDSDDSMSDHLTSDDSMSDDGKSTINRLEQVTVAVIDILTLHLGRWGRLHLDKVPDILKRCADSILLRPAVGSDSLSMELPGPTPEFRMESEPQLTESPLTSINTGWDNITHATFSCCMMSVEAVLDFLQQAPNLEYYSFSIESMVTPVIKFETPLVHPRLRSLNQRGTSYTKKLLDSINLPSLEEWSQHFYGGIIPVAAMLSLLKRSSCCLTALNLENVPASIEDLDNLLQAIPSLERLGLSIVYSPFDPNGSRRVIDAILVRIFCPPPSTSDTSVENKFLPRLRLLECTPNSPEFVPFSWDCIPQLYRQGHRKSLTLKSTGSKWQIPNRTTLQLLQLIDEGVDLQILDDSIGGDFLANFRREMRSLKL